MANYNLTQTGDEVQAYIDSIPVIDVTGTLSGSNIVFATNPYTQIAANYAANCGSIVRLTVGTAVYLLRVTQYDGTNYTAVEMSGAHNVVATIGSSSASATIDAGIDATPTQGSNNLITSGGVWGQLNGDEDITASLTFTTGKYIDNRNGNPITNSSCKFIDYVSVSPGEKIKATISSNLNSNTFRGLAWYNANKVYISGVQGPVRSESTNVLTEFVAPNNAAYVRISEFTDEATRGAIQFIRITSKFGQIDTELADHETRISANTANISAEQIKTAKLSKEEISLTLTSPSVSEQSSTLWNYYYVVVNPPATDCTATFNKALAYNEYIYMYDKHGALIGQVGYAVSRSSFTMLANTARVDVILRKNIYSNTAAISISYTAPIHDVFYNTQLLSNLYVGDSNNIRYENANRVIARIAVKPNTDYALVTDSNFVLTSGSPAATNIYAADGTLLSHVAITTKEVFKTGLVGYRITTPANAAYIYTTISTGTSVIADITIAEVVEYTALNIKTGVSPLSVWCFGDSISATAYQTGVYPWITNGSASFGLGGWISRFLLQTKIRPKKWYNFSRGGYTLSDTTPTLDGDSYLKRVNYAISAYNNGDVDAPDVVMIVGCTNDIDASSNRAVTNAEIEASSYDNYEDYVEHTFFTQAGGDYNHRPLISIADVNKGKIIGAIRYIIEQLGTLFPDVRFMVVTPPQTSRKTFQSQWQCVRDMKYAAMRLCLPCADVWGEAQMPLLWDYNADWNADSLNHRFLDDGIHTYDAGNDGTIVTGYIRQGNYIARKFNEFFDDITFP